jgi:hypothetical protein
LINIIKEKLEKINNFENNFLTKKNLKRALMCQPYNVGRISAKSYMKENLDMIDYNENREEYDKLIDKVIDVLCDLKENQLFKKEFDKLIKEIINNNYILKLSDIEISMSYNKILTDKRIIVK